MQDADDGFFERADAHIRLCNEQIGEKASLEAVNASNMYAVARFSAWVSACGWNSGEGMADAKQAILNALVADYRKMLEENLDDYIRNFESYMRLPE